MQFLYGLLFSTLTSNLMLFNHVIGFATCPQFADNEDFQSEWREVKRRNKIKVASFLKEKTGYLVNPDAMFDVQVIFCISNICSVSLVLCVSYFIMEKQKGNHYTNELDLQHVNTFEFRVKGYQWNCLNPSFYSYNS